MKKIIGIFIAVALIFNMTAFAFSYPEPDWGALLRAKEKMVKCSELQLYTEGAVSSAPYYGAKFEPRGGAYLGMIAENSVNFAPVGAYLTYIDDMYQDDFYYPANRMIQDDNVITMVGWTIKSLDSIDYDHMRNVLSTINSYGKPMFIRFANEMNVSALGDDPYKYVDAFRSVANMVHEYENLAVVWSPNDMGALDRPFEYFYPGDEYVDWIGVSCYSIKYFMGKKDTPEKDSVYFMTGDYAWATNRIKPIVEFMEKNNINKPLMLSECGVPTNNHFGEDLEWWAIPRFKNLLYAVTMKYPQVKMINYFNTHRAGEKERFDITDYPYAADVFNEARESGAYITEYGTNPEFVFSAAENGEHLTADENNVVRLYSHAYEGGIQDITVTYSVDGAWYHSASSAPYKCNLDISGISDGMHTLTISTGISEKSYTFYKYKNIIRFGAEVDKSLVPEIKVFVNGDEVIFDQPPVLKDGRTLVPIRAVFEKMGFYVDWIDETQTAVISNDENVVYVTVGSEEIKHNGEILISDVAAQIISNRVLIPLRVISESLEFKVDWDGDTQTVYITK